MNPHQHFEKDFHLIKASDLAKDQLCANLQIHCTCGNNINVNKLGITHYYPQLSVASTGSNNTLIHKQTDAQTY